MTRNGSPFPESTKASLLAARQMQFNFGAYKILTAFAEGKNPNPQLLGELLDLIVKMQSDFNELLYQLTLDGPGDNDNSVKSDTPQNT